MYLKVILALGCIAHLVCGYTDCLLGFTKSGRLNLKNIDDNEKMSAMFADFKINNALISMLLGVAAIAAFTFSYLALSEWMEQFSRVCAKIMYISAVAGMIILVCHHVFCGTVYWFYVRLGRTEEAREAVMEFFKKTAVTMIAGYIGLAAFVITLFIAIVSGMTSLPRWACVFNTLPLILVLAPTKLPAKGNIAGALMYLGLTFLI